MIGGWKKLYEWIDLLHRYTNRPLLTCKSFHLRQNRHFEDIQVFKNVFCSIDRSIVILSKVSDLQYTSVDYKCVLV